jgi:hypothetical protein
MSPRKVPPPPTSEVQLRRPRSGSWMALLAEATLPAARTVQAEVRADVGGGSEPMRLVVQVFGRGRRPLGAAQRAVSAAELRRGVRVDVVQVGGEGETPRVVAWVEPGAPDLEYEGLEAAPTARARLLDAQVAA